MFPQKRLWPFFLLSSLFICLLPLIALGKEKVKTDLTERPFLIIKGYIIQASSGGQELAYPPAPLTSVAVLEQIAERPNVYYQKLETLYSFSRFQLLEIFRFTYQIKDSLRPSIEKQRTVSTTISNEWGQSTLAVKIFPLRIEESGMIQLQLEVKKDSRPYLRTNISVQEKKPVLAGRMIEGQKDKGLFIAFTPLLSETEEEIVGFHDPPKLLELVKPEYPSKALRDEVGGTVILKIFVDETGKVTEAKVLQSVREDLDMAAIKAAQRCKFEPSLLDGKPVGVWVSYPVRFILKSK
jgi:TonB family protein